MKAALAFALYCTIFVSARRRAPPSSQETTAATEATTTAAAAVETSSDDEVQTLVKAYIDAGTCGEVTTGDSCGDSAESYYSEFEYNGRRVVIANGIPNHDAEHDQYFVNPNTRCERWTFMSLPLSPSQGSSPVSTNMGVTGLATTGGTFYNHLSSPKGDVAMYNEGTSLDSCTTMPTSCAMLMLRMPVFVPRLDMLGMVFLFTDSAMMPVALSLPPVTASNQDILSLLSAWLLELSSLLSTTATMSLTVLETVTWMRPMVRSTQQLVSTPTL